MTFINLPNIGGYVHASSSVLPHTIATQVRPVSYGLGEAFKPKKEGKNGTHIIFVLDDSGSMQSCRDTTISGFNEFLENQKKQDGELFISLYKFDGYNVNGVYQKTKAADVAPLTRETYDPNGMTNLYDGIGSCLLTINEDLASMKKKERQSVVVVVMTDGGENSSKTFGQQDIFQMVSKAKEKEWGFIFMGANIDAFATGGGLGFEAAATMQFTNASSQNAMKSMSELTTRMRSYSTSGYTKSAFYNEAGLSDYERTVAMAKDE